MTVKIKAMDLQLFAGEKRKSHLKERRDARQRGQVFEVGDKLCFSPIGLLYSLEDFIS